MRWWSWMWFKQGQIEIEYGDESEFGDVECGDGHAEGTSPAGIPLPPLHPPNNTPNNQSKPIVPTLSPISL